MTNIQINQFAQRAITILASFALVSVLSSKVVTPLPCYGDKLDCDSVAGKVPCSILGWWYELESSNAWMCNGSTVSNTTTCVTDETGNCCSITRAASCVTATCPCTSN